MGRYLILTAIIISLSFIAHPLHISVVDIEHDSNRNALEITHRIFLDDIENAVRIKSGIKNLDITQPGNAKNTDDYMKEYLKEHFIVSVDGKVKPYSYLGHEIESDVIFCYMEIPKIKKVGKLKVFYNLLFETFDDQTNLIHFKYNDKTRSIKLSGKDVEDEIIVQ